MVLAVANHCFHSLNLTAPQKLAGKDAANPKRRVFRNFDQIRPVRLPDFRIQGHGRASPARCDPIQSTGLPGQMLQGPSQGWRVRPKIFGQSQSNINSTFIVSFQLPERPRSGIGLQSASRRRRLPTFGAPASCVAGCRSPRETNFQNLCHNRTRFALMKC